MTDRTTIKEKFHKLFTRAENEKIGIDILTDESWHKSRSHVTHFEYQTSYVTIGAKGCISEHLLTAVLAHELGHHQRHQKVKPRG
jgi:hypothetical protein